MTHTGWQEVQINQPYLLILVCPQHIKTRVVIITLRHTVW